MSSTQDGAAQAELEEFLRESPELFLEALDEGYRKKLWKYIKHRTSGLLDRHEIKDVYQETLIGVWKQITKPGFDPSEPMRMVYTVAHGKAVDALRKWLREPEKSSEDDLVQTVAAELTGTNAGRKWGYFTAEERREFRETVFSIIESLPERQRIVAWAFANHIEEFRARDTYKPLADAVSKVTGRPESVANVKAAWHEARRKIRDGLEQKGFGFA